nr:MAG TPA: hypothetical protein [Caudoviricetes sp.]
MLYSVHIQFIFACYTIDNERRGTQWGPARSAPQMKGDNHHDY